MTRNTFPRLPVLGLVALVAAAALAAAPPRRNLLVNPGFEQPREGHEWMPAGWDTTQSDFTTTFFGRDTFMVEHGHYAVSVANVSMLRPSTYNWNQAVVVGREAWGKDAVLSAWTRSNGIQGRAYILLQAFQDTVGKMTRIWGVTRDEAYDRLDIKRIGDPLVELGSRREYFSDRETGWVHRTVRVYVPPSVNVLWVRLGILGTGQVLFDDASLTLEPAQPPPPLRLRTNLLADPSFEGNGDQWEYTMPPYAGMLVVRDTTVAHTGRASMRMEGGLEGLVQLRAGVGQGFPIRTLGGKRVRLSGYLKTDSLVGVAYVMLYASTPRGVVIEPAPKQYSMTNDWTPVSTEMDLPADTYNLWGWFLYNAPAKGRLYYDDCSLEVLGPARGKPGNPVPR